VNRSLPIVLVLIAVVALGFVLLSPRSPQTVSSTPSSSPTAQPNPTPSNPANPVVSPPTPTSLQVPSRVLEGGIDLPLEGENLRVAVLVGTQRIADVPAPGGKFRITLPEKLENVPLNALSDVPLPHGDGRLQSTDGALGAVAHVFAYQDVNGNKRLDEGEPSVEGELSKTDLAPDLRGFFKNELVLTSKPASLNEAQDSRTGAKGYYRYKLDLNPGWHVLEGEFASNGYDVREATGSGWNLVVPFKPTAPGPKTPQQ
jgi:hypothetical protein